MGLDMFSKPTGKHYQDFMDFNNANPQVVYELRGMSYKLLATNNHLSLKMMFGVLRYRAMVEEIESFGDYKLPDQFTSYYARLLMATDGDLWGKFEIRASEADAMPMWQDALRRHGGYSRAA